MGQPGGCNPIPLKATNSNGQITIAAADLKALDPPGSEKSQIGDRPAPERGPLPRTPPGGPCSSAS